VSPLIRSPGGEIGPAAENLTNRTFRAGAPSEKWITDITEFQVPAGKVYLSPLIDCFDGLVVSWIIGTRPNAELVNTMLDEAIKTVANSNKRPVVHSDRGAHYRWPGWLARIRDAKPVRSMSRKGCSPERGLRRLLRSAQNRVVPSVGLADYDRRAVH
jgi:transposase InsO family protein